MNQPLHILTKQREHKIDELKLLYQKQAKKMDKDFGRKSNDMLFDIIVHDTKMLSYLVNINSVLKKEIEVLNESYDEKIKLMDFLK